MNIERKSKSCSSASLCQKGPKPNSPACSGESFWSSQAQAYQKNSQRKGTHLEFAGACLWYLRQAMLIHICPSTMCTVSCRIDFHQPGKHHFSSNKEVLLSPAGNHHVSNNCTPNAIQIWIAVQVYGESRAPRPTLG